LNNQVLFDKATYEKLYKEVPQYKLITPSVVSERLKVRGSLARRALLELRDKGEKKTPKLCLVKVMLIKWSFRFNQASRRPQRPDDLHPNN
jgi:hypothetical protein